MVGEDNGVRPRRQWPGCQNAAWPRAHLRATEKGLGVAAKKSPTFFRKFGPKAAEGLGKVSIVLTIVFVAADAKAAIDHVDKGGTIELGPSLDTKELTGETKIDVKGPGKDQSADVPGDVTLNDTVIDIETKGVPQIGGSADITADKVTVRGAAGGDDGDGSSSTSRPRSKIRRSPSPVRV